MNMALNEQFAQLDFYPLWSALSAPNGPIDPFDFEQRMAVYKLLIEASNARGVFGPDNALNVFWGYVFQLDWQQRSGRLQLSGTPPGRIDPNSMWGFGNYTLSIIPLVAAMRKGLTTALEILPTDRPADFPYVSGGAAGDFQIPDLFAQAVSAWEKFFGVLQQTNPGDDLEALRIELWKAHFHSLTVIETLVQDIGPRYFSRAEVDFLIGWIRMVDFLGSAAWRTDLPFMLENGKDTLPTRLLREEDAAGKMADMNDRINGNVKNVVGLARQSKLQFAFNLWLWKRAMRTRQARDEVLPMLDATFNPSPRNVKERRRLLGYMLRL